MNTGCLLSTSQTRAAAGLTRLTSAGGGLWKTPGGTSLLTAAAQALTTHVAFAAHVGEDHRAPIGVVARWMAGANIMRKFVIIVLILIAAVVTWFKWNFPTASYRYRLTVAVEVDGRVHSGSSVIEVWHRFNPRTLWHFAGVYNDYVWGQAVLIDLDARGVLVAALGAQSQDNCTVAARYLVGRAYEPSASRRACVTGYPATIENERALARMRGTVELTPDNLPPFIWFSDPADPRTARLVKPNDFASVIGDTARLSSAQVEITNDPIVIDIDKKLPLYATLPPPSSSNSLSLPNGLFLNWSMFIAPGSVQ